MRCDWQCPHKKCTKLCGELCDRGPCNVPCPKLIPDCKHPCIGLCGEVCPPICRICDPELLDDPYLGPPEADARFVLLEDCNHVLGVTDLDRWVQLSMTGGRSEDREEEHRGSDSMDTAHKGSDFAHDAETEDQRDDKNKPRDRSDEEDEMGNEGQAAAAGGERQEEDTEMTDRSIKLPECSRCKTPIRRNLRYGNFVKKALKEVEEIKRRCRGDPTAVDKLYRKVEQAKTHLPHDLRQQVQSLFSKPDVPSESLLSTKFYQISMITDANNLLIQVSSAMTRWQDLANTYKTVKADLDHLIAWTLQPRNILSDQERLDVRQEFKRLAILIPLMHCLHAIKEDKIEVEPRLMCRLAACVRQLQVLGSVNDHDLDEGRRLQEELKDVVQNPYTILTDEERESIIKAVALPTGSWYACPKGHYYVIGECGRPMEVASCPECRNQIGGQNHALVNRNREAPEFDNAPGPRWTEEDDLEYAIRLQEEEFINWH